MFFLEMSNLKVGRLSEDPGMALEILPELAQSGKPIFLRPDKLKSALTVFGFEATVDTVDVGSKELPTKRLLKAVDTERRIGATQVSNGHADALGGASFDARLKKRYLCMAS